MNKYNVTAVIQSPGEEPVGVDWAVATDELGVIESITQLLKNNQPSDILFPPPITLSVSVRLIYLDVNRA